MSWLVLALIAFILVAAVGAAITYFEYHGFGLQDGIFRHGDGEGAKIAALTFDDGPSRDFTPQILDILRSKNVKATFFLTGQMAEQNQDIARRIADEGHEIGNHTYTHVNMVFLSSHNLISEIERGEAAITAAVGRQPLVFRPPRGLFNETIRRSLIERGYRVILWSVSAADWSLLPAWAISLRVRRFTRPGAVILFHDGGSLVKNSGGNRAKTVAVLPRVIDYLKAKGYILVTAGELASRM
jgi:peptidoglycan-N-acetylglucosamine deacetylase